jgi:hypothetical protein
LISPPSSFPPRSFLEAGKIPSSGTVFLIQNGIVGDEQGQILAPFILRIFFSGFRNIPSRHQKGRVKGEISIIFA